MHAEFLHHLSSIGLAADSGSAKTAQSLLAYLAVTQVILLLLIIFTCMLAVYIVMLKREIRKLKGIGDGLSQALWAHRRDKMHDEDHPKKMAIHDRVRKSLFSDKPDTSEADADAEKTEPGN